MAAISVVPIILNDVVIKNTSNEWQAHVSQVTFTPTSSVVRWKGMTPASNHVFGTLAEWTVALDFAQDWETADSLSMYLLEHETERETWTFEPKADGASFASNVVLTPGGIGGQVDSVATSSATLACTKPVRSAAA